MVHRYDTAGLTELVLDNPGARHALSLGMMVDLATHVEALASHDGVAVLVRSAGGAFCAGGDLRQVRSTWGSPEAGRVVATSMVQTLDALWNLPQVVVAAVDGPAVGGGAELTTASDLRWLGPRAQVEFRQVRLGVAAGWGGVGRLLTQVPHAVAAHWLVGAGVVEAQRAEQVGFALPAAGATGEEAARAWIRTVLGSPPVAVRAMKAQILAGRSRGGDRSAEVSAFEAVWGGPAHRAAMGLV